MDATRTPFQHPVEPQVQEKTQVNRGGIISNAILMLVLILSTVFGGVTAFALLDHFRRSPGFGGYESELPGKHVPILVEIRDSEVPNPAVVLDDGSGKYAMYRYALLTWTINGWSYVHVVEEERIYPETFAYFVENDGKRIGFSEPQNMETFRRPLSESKLESE